LNRNLPADEFAQLAVVGELFQIINAVSRLGGCWSENNDHQRLVLSQARRAALQCTACRSALFPPLAQPFHQAALFLAGTHAFLRRRRVCTRRALAALAKATHQILQCRGPVGHDGFLDWRRCRLLSRWGPERTFLVWLPS